MAYIDREEFRRKLIDEKSFYPTIVARALEEMPDADVVEVVRCRNCKKRTEESIAGGTFCLIHEACVPFEYYCASGERRSE